MFGPWVLNKIWITEFSSALIGMLMSSSKLFLPFFERSSFKLSCETVIGIVLCCCHQACCLLYCLGEINSGIHMYQFTFEPWHFCFRMWLWVRISTKSLVNRRIWRKKARIFGFAHPYSPPTFVLIERNHSWLPKIIGQMKIHVYGKRKALNLTEQIQKNELSYSQHMQISHYTTAER